MTSQPRPASHWLNIAAMLAPDLAFETNIGGCFTAFGSAEVLGFPAAGLLGRKLSDLFALEGNSGLDADAFGGIVATIYGRGIEWRGMVVLQRTDGVQRRYQLLLAPKIAIYGTEGSVDGAYGLLIDGEAPALRMATPDTERTSAMLDPQTGLWSAATFTEEAGRRFDRLDVEGLPGTLLLIGFNRTKAIGRNAVATRLAEELRGHHPAHRSAGPARTPLFSPCGATAWTISPAPNAPPASASVCRRPCRGSLASRSGWRPAGGQDRGCSDADPPGRCRPSPGRPGGAGGGRCRQHGIRRRRHLARLEPIAATLKSDPVEAFRNSLW